MKWNSPPSRTSRAPCPDTGEVPVQAPFFGVWKKPSFFGEYEEVLRLLVVHEQYPR